jgi:hypothetical protein
MKTKNLKIELAISFVATGVIVAVIEKPIEPGMWLLIACFGGFIFYVARRAHV